VSWLVVNWWLLCTKDRQIFWNTIIICLYGIGDFFAVIMVPLACRSMSRAFVGSAIGTGLIRGFLNPSDVPGEDKFLLLAAADCSAWVKLGNICKQEACILHNLQSDCVSAIVILCRVILFSLLCSQYLLIGNLIALISKAPLGAGKSKDNRIVLNFYIL